MVLKLGAISRAARVFGVPVKPPLRHSNIVAVEEYLLVLLDPIDSLRVWG